MRVPPVPLDGFAPVRRIMKSWKHLTWVLAGAFVLLLSCILPGLNGGLSDASLMTLIAGLQPGGSAAAGSSPYYVKVTGPGSIFTSESGTVQTIGLSLNTLPTATVSLTVQSSDSTEGEVSLDGTTYTPSVLVVINPATYSTPVTVYVRGVDDVILDGNVTYTIILGATTSSDPDYNGLKPADISAVNFDNEYVAGSVGIAVAPTSGLITTEQGGTAQFGVVLQSLPAANVTIGLSSSSPTEGVPSVASLTFTPANWNTVQTVTVTGVNDGVVDGNVVYQIVTAPAVSADPAYNGLNAPDVTLTNLGNTPGVVVTPTGGLSVSESGTSVSFSVYLTSRPAANVTIPMSSSNVAEGTIVPASLTFTPANWSTPQTVTVTGVDDTVADGNQTFSIITGLTVSTDPDYNGTIDPADVTVINVDNDVTGITVISTTSIITSENGLSQSFKIVLNSSPSGSNIVTLPVSVSDSTEGTITAPFVGNSGNLTFTTANWNLPQTVTVTGVDDALIDGTIAYSVVIGPSTSGDPAYNNVNPADIPAINLDNETPAGVTVSPSTITTFEGDISRQFFVVLNAAPTANVVLPVTNTNTGQVVISAPFTGATGNLTFTPGNWNVPQAVTIRAFENGVIDVPGPVNFSITIGPDTTTTDPNYLNLNPPDLSVSVSHADKHAFVVRDGGGAVVTSKGLLGAGGIAGADSLCAAAVNNPGGTYKALIVDGSGARRACTSANCLTAGLAEHVGWVLQPNTMYFFQYYPGPTWVPGFRAGQYGIYSFQSGLALLNPMVESGNTSTWSGLMADWTTSTNHCTNWTIDTGGTQGSGGGVSNLDYRAIYTTPAPSCSNSGTILCVEQ